MHPEAWCRAIYADDTAVGFLMLHDENLRPNPRQDDFYFLWRLMIDAGHQGKGHAKEAMGLLIRHVAARPNARVLHTSCHEGDGSPEGFYLGLGFSRSEDQGDGSEIRLSLPL